MKNNFIALTALALCNLNERKKNQEEETCEVIVECDNEETGICANLSKIGKIKYPLPMINSYVVEVTLSKAATLKGTPGIKSVHQSAFITAQMNQVRKSVKADCCYTGKGVAVAFLDTGISPVNDFVLPKNRLLAFRDFVGDRNEAYDDNGHGTHVAGIAAGNGFLSKGLYKGIAPECNIISLKVLDAKGQGNSGNVLAGIQWLLDNKEKYNIRIANLSIGTAQNSIGDPLIKAVEACWDRGIVITAAAGNNGPKPGSITSPGVCKKIITVGSSDDAMTRGIWGTSQVHYSGCGPTRECIVKPDIVAPGNDIVSCSCGTKKRTEHYAKLSGTSMATPVVAGAIALLLEKEPSLTPNEVKLKIKDCAVDLSQHHNRQGWGLIDVCRMLE